MGKNLMKTILPVAAVGLGAGAMGVGPLAGMFGKAAAAGAGEGAATGLLGNAFGSADMVSKAGLLGAHPAAAAAGTIETAGVDFIDGKPQNLGAAFEWVGNEASNFMDGMNNSDMLKMLRMGQPQQEQQQSAGGGGVRQAPQVTQVEPLYGQPQVELTPEKKALLELLWRQKNGIA